MDIPIWFISASKHRTKQATHCFGPRIGNVSRWVSKIDWLLWLAFISLSLSLAILKTQKYVNTQPSHRSSSTCSSTWKRKSCSHCIHFDSLSWLVAAFVFSLLYFCLLLFYFSCNSLFVIWHLKHPKLTQTTLKLLTVWRYHYAVVFVAVAIR